jgi:hypothetical protein
MDQRIAKFTWASRIRRRSRTLPSSSPAGISRTATSGSMPGCPARRGAGQRLDLGAQPAEAQDAIHPGQDVVVWNQPAQRSGHA